MLEWLVLQGVALFLKPAADQVLATFTERVGDRLGSAASDWAIGWIKRVVGTDATGQEELAAEATAHAADLRQVGAVLQERFGLNLPATTAEHPPGSDGDVLDAYDAVLWRVAATAWWANRPIAIEGALQGEGWLLACDPTGRSDAKWLSDGDELALPALDDVWGRGEKELWKPPFPAAEFWVKRVPDATSREALLRETEDDFKDDGGRPRSESDKPVDARWLRMDGVHARWLYLEPDVQALLHIRRANDDHKRITGSDVTEPRRWKDYPPEWHPLIKIDDAPVGIAAVLAGVEAFAERDAAFRAAVRRAVETGLRT